MPERYAGIAYASVSGGHGAGGWQVHSRSPGLPEDDERLLTARVVTAFESHHGGLPQFVEPDVLAALPVRFSAESSEAGVVVRQATQAGADATGRPGNVFTTVLLDREPGRPPLPVLLWRSPDLLAPFGAGEVAAAAPPWTVRPGAEVGRETVAGLVLDSDSWAVLTVLLDAVARAVAGGGTVVLRTDDQDAAALHLGAICLLTAPAWSSRLSWSLYERGSSLDRLHRAGAHIVVVPHGDDLAPAPNDIVLALDEEPSLGVLGGADHVTAAGQRVPVTAWSELATELFALEPAEVVAALAAVAGAEGRPSGDPAWWLAAALAGSDVLPVDLHEAASAVLRQLPAPQGTSTVEQDVLRHALGRGEGGAVALRAALAAMPVHDGRRALLAERFVRAALSDVEWLDSASGSRPLAAALSVHVETDEVARALRDLLAAAPPSSPARLANTVDLLEIAGLLGAGDARIDEPLSDLVQQTLPAITSDSAREMAAVLARLAPQVRAGLLTALARGLEPGAQAAVAAVLVFAEELGAREVLRLLAGASGPVSLAAAGALLARDSNPDVAARVAETVRLHPGRWERLPAAERRALHADAWSLPDLLAALAVLPGVVAESRLVERVATGVVPEELDAGAVPALAAAALRLRVGSDEALRDGRWRGDRADDARILWDADLLAGGDARTTDAFLRPSMRLRPVVALLIDHLDDEQGDSPLRIALRRRRPPLDPLPAAAAAVLAHRLRDEQVLPAALAYAASDRTGPDDDALRRALVADGGDLLDLALADVLAGLGHDRVERAVEAADAMLAVRMRDRLLRRSPVHAYLDRLPTGPMKEVR